MRMLLLGLAGVGAVAVGWAAAAPPSKPLTEPGKTAAAPPGDNLPPPAATDVQLVERALAARKEYESSLKALYEHWLHWGERPGGCFFVGASAELDDRPGAPRDALVRACKDWIDAIGTAAQIAISEGHFRADLDARQFAFELYGVMLAAHTFSRFLHDRGARGRTQDAFERLLAASRPAAGSRRKSD